MGAAYRSMSLLVRCVDESEPITTSSRSVTTSGETTTVDSARGRMWFSSTHRYARNSLGSRTTSGKVGETVPKGVADCSARAVNGNKGRVASKYSQGRGSRSCRHTLPARGNSAARLSVFVLSDRRRQLESYSIALVCVKEVPLRDNGCSGSLHRSAQSALAGLGYGPRHRR
jgi:hypothetical protein